MSTLAPNLSLGAACLIYCPPENIDRSNKLSSLSEIANENNKRRVPTVPRRSVPYTTKEA